MERTLGRTLNNRELSELLAEVKLDPMEKTLNDRELSELLADVTMEEALNARKARKARKQLATSTPPTFLQEVLLMVLTFFLKLIGWKADRATKHAGPRRPRPPRGKQFRRHV